MTKKRKPTGSAKSTKASKRNKAKAVTRRITPTTATTARSSALMHAPKLKTAAKNAPRINATPKPKSAAQVQKPKPKTSQKSTPPTRGNNQTNSIARKSKVRPDKQPPKRKNVSQKVLNGTMIHTRDEYLGGAHGFNKDGSTRYYRKAIVVDSNRKNDLALMKLTSSKKGKPVPGDKKATFKPYIETKDNEGRPIRISYKFIGGHKSKKLPANVANELKKVAILDEREGEKNRNKLKRLKKRK